MTNFNFWKQVKETIDQNIEVIVCVVVSHTGSSPGKTGFKLLVDQRGKTYGTVGGGIMEFDLLQELTTRFNNFNGIEFKEYVHRESVANRSGSICSGKQTIFIQKVKRTEFSEIIKNYGSKKYLHFTSYGLKIEDHISDEHYCEELDYKNKIHLFGCGHIGYATSRILNTLDFHISLYDHRELDLINENIFVHKKYIGPYEQHIANIQQNDFVVIVTFGYDFDLRILKSIHNHLTPKYIGLMGSKTKVKKIFYQLRSSGVSHEFIDNINAPIGLKISDGTAEEIAVSICAQILEIKNTNLPL